MGWVGSILNVNYYLFYFPTFHNKFESSHKTPETLQFISEITAFALPSGRYQGREGSYNRPVDNNGWVVGGSLNHHWAATLQVVQKMRTKSPVFKGVWLLSWYWCGLLSEDPKIGQLGLIMLDNDVLDSRTGKTTFLALTLQSWQMPDWAG